MARIEDIRHDGELEAARKQARREMLDGKIVAASLHPADVQLRITERTHELADAMQQDRFRRPHYAVCGLGKSRWFWVAEEHHWFWHGPDGDISARPVGERWPEIQSGYGPDRATALQLAREAAGPDGLETDAGYAQSVHLDRAHAQRKARLEREAERNAGERTTGVQEFVYAVHGRYEGGCEVRRHPIVRKTARYVFVQPPYPGSRGRTLRLDRGRLEREGKIPSRPGMSGHPTFYADPPDLADWNRTRGGALPTSVAAALVRLELHEGAGADDIERAYRRMAKQAHPDRGGDADGFLAVQAAYETAIAHARGGRP